MRHFLNTRLKGKTSPAGSKLYSVYVEINTHGDTYLLKSRLIRGMLDEDMFDTLTKSDDNSLSALITKDRNIIEHIVQMLAITGELTSKNLNESYKYHTISLSHWLSSFRYISYSKDLKSLGIVELMNEYDDSYDVDIANQLEKVQNSLGFHLTEVLSLMERYGLEVLHQSEPHCFFFIYDWKYESLKRNFTSYLDKLKKSKAQIDSCLEFIDEAIRIAERTD
jgi:hypothetical protein